MLRQRLTLKGTPLADVVSRVLVVLLALGLIWYGAMLVALAFKVSSEMVNTLSGYRDAYDYLAGLKPGDFDGSTRLAIAAAGLICAGLFGSLAWRLLPRPHWSRTALRLRDEADGTVEVAPRAVERAAELGALQTPSITAARARLTQEEVTLDVGVGSASLPVADTLSDAQARARAALAQHQLPTLPVSVTLAQFDRKNRRELQ